MDYNFREIEPKWQRRWSEDKTFRADNQSSKPKYYVLDMFPYPSGAGLHVGHPLGYIASDIVSRYKRLQGFNVLHPMGYDAYGLPAEQYAIQTGTHPEITTAKNIGRYREQMDKIGFSFDWEREVRTCDPFYYKWTQWTFIQLFNHWYDKSTNKAEPVAALIKYFESNGSIGSNAASDAHDPFTAAEWMAMTEKQQQEILMNYRIAYLSDSWVNWCVELGTVLANDEVSNGLSVRGGYPVERKLMRQWSLRISAYAQRLLDGLETVEWSDSLKEIQKNWIGRSEGCEVSFAISGLNENLKVFTTRPDTLFGVTFMVLAPEHDLVGSLTKDKYREAVESYLAWTKNRSERERMTEVKQVSGQFTGSYAVNPLTGQEIPIYIADYVLTGYGTGAIMAVPGHDSRDFAFARHFNLPIVQVVCRQGEETSDPATWLESYDSKEGILVNSGFISGMQVKEAMRATIDHIETMGLGRGTINFRLRDAIFSRQRYWGEPFPVYYKDGMPYMLPENELPLRLPDVNAYLPTASGEPPLARAENWTYNGYPLETNTMPGFAGSSGYYLRYMDAANPGAYFSKEAVNYWRSVDLYIGGAEHATGHLIYARFWNKFLYDIGMAVEQEPFRKLINQGMIQGRSSFVYRLTGTNKFVSFGLKDRYDVQEIHVDISIVDNDILDTEKFRRWRPDLSDAEFILEDGKYHCGHEVEKMSKSLYNVQNPDDLVERYGADTLRLYEMFLGPLEQAKPWDTKGIEGTFRFIRKFWKLFHDRDNNFLVSDEPATDAELKTLHKTIKKVQEDTERFSFNTCVASFMICANELTDLKCNKRCVLEPLVALLSPFAPHIAEELWSLLGNNGSVSFAGFPSFDEKYLVESIFEYPVSFNGKMRFTMALPIDLPAAGIEKAVLANEKTLKYLEGKQPRKMIVVPGKIVNIVL
ncbi:MAG TPA: leucine--tRNA ligase [Bacteroidales bacterium]|nr:MAG: leucine--tRNA ligase [Bacteroidetes bacterium GWE2_42_24]HBZ65873.1 leucine--tRNA ligase [Bacteroidales bacterium]